MRIITYCLLFVSFVGNAQPTMPSVSIPEWNRIIALAKSEQAIRPEDVANLPVYQFGQRWHVSIMGIVRPDADWSQMDSFEVIRGSRVGNICSLKVPLDVIDNIDFEAVFSYMELPGSISPDLHKVIVDVRADSVHQGINLPEAFTGKDVLIGVTDWGFDYTHPMFYDTLLIETRIVAAWDQYKQVGNSPDNFLYGVEYDSTSELLSAQSDTANIYSYHTHGSHVAGIAGGGAAGTEYRGMAPEAGFLFATFLIDAASVLDAFVWMKEIADEQQKRLVINMSWGLYYIGTLDGNSLLSQAIDALSEEGVVFVSSAGNNGDNNFHIKKEFDNDTMTTRIGFDSYSNPVMWGQSVTMWGEAAMPFGIKLQVFNGVNTLLLESPLYETTTAGSYLDSILVINEDTVFFNLSVDEAHPLNGRPHMRLRVKNTNTAYKIILSAQSDAGTVHFWNLVELTNGVGNWGLPLYAFGTNGLGGDPENSIGEPACTESVIAVAAYSSSYISTGGNLVGGQLASFSSEGPLITNVMKPDIAAPGVNVTSSISAFTDASYVSSASIVFEEVEYDFAKFSGTSMSSPCVAGIVALLLDANPDLSPEEIKTILQLTAREDDETGDISAPGDVRWGYGKVNAYAAVIMAVQYLNSGEWVVAENQLIISPNPTHSVLSVMLSNERTPKSVCAISLDGKKINLPLLQGTVDCTELSAGMYLLEVSDGSQTFVKRFIKH